MHFAKSKLTKNAVFLKLFEVFCKGEKIAILEARKQLCWYLRGVSHAGYYKQQIVSMNTLADAEKIVRGIQRDLR